MASIVASFLAVAVFLGLQFHMLLSASRMLTEGDDWRYQAAFRMVPYLCILGAAAIACAAGVPRLAVVPPLVYVGIG